MRPVLPDGFPKAPKTPAIDLPSHTDLGPRKPPTSGLVVRAADLKVIDYRRFKSGLDQVDFLLNGGPIEGFSYIVGGEPGSGKTTMLMQLLGRVGGVYYSGEQNNKDLSNLMDRLGVRNNPELYLLQDDQNSIRTIEDCFQAVLETKSRVAVIDSIQTVRTATLDLPINHPTVKDRCLEIIHQNTKRHDLTTFVVGQINGEGNFEGKKSLEHLVDGVLLFEGNRNSQHKRIKCLKHRGGPSHHMAYLYCSENGFVDDEASDPDVNPDGPVLNEQEADAQATKTQDQAAEREAKAIAIFNAKTADTLAPTPEDLRTDRDRGPRRLRMR